jgi:hypothetical protein
VKYLLSGAVFEPACADRSSSQNRSGDGVRVPSGPQAREVAPSRGRSRGETLLKNWRILGEIRSSPSRAGELVAAVQTVMIAST